MMTNLLYARKSRALHEKDKIIKSDELSDDSSEASYDSDDDIFNLDAKPVPIEEIIGIDEIADDSDDKDIFNLDAESLHLSDKEDKIIGLDEVANKFAAEPVSDKTLDKGEDTFDFIVKQIEHEKIDKPAPDKIKSDKEIRDILGGDLDEVDQRREEDLLSLLGLNFDKKQEGLKEPVLSKTDSILKKEADNLSEELYKLSLQKDRSCEDEDFILHPERMEAIFERVIVKVFSEKIKSMIFEAAEKAIAKEMVKFKQSLFIKEDEE